MRTKIFGGIAVLAIVAVAAWNVNLNSQPSYKLSDTMLANVEALAQETGTGARSCSLSWKVSVLGITTEKSCSVTCDIGYNAKCELKKCECVKA
jgi:hypothetical protein